jgi:hypothetical protein
MNDLLLLGYVEVAAKHPSPRVLPLVCLDLLLLRIKSLRPLSENITASSPILFGPKVNIVEREDTEAFRDFHVSEIDLPPDNVVQCPPDCPIGRTHRFRVCVECAFGFSMMLARYIGVVFVCSWPLESKATFHAFEQWPFTRFC